MNTKILMGGAAGIAGLLWWMNRQSASTPAPAVTRTASTIGGAVSGLTAAATKPLQVTIKVPDTAATSPAPAPPPAASNPSNVSDFASAEQKLNSMVAAMDGPAFGTSSNADFGYRQTDQYRDDQKTVGSTAMSVLGF